MIGTSVRKKLKSNIFYHSQVLTVPSKQKFDPNDKRVTISKTF